MLQNKKSKNGVFFKSGVLFETTLSTVLGRFFSVLYYYFTTLVNWLSRCGLKSHSNLSCPHFEGPRRSIKTNRDHFISQFFHILFERLSNTIVVHCNIVLYCSILVCSENYGMRYRAKKSRKFAQILLNAIKQVTGISIEGSYL